MSVQDMTKLVAHALKDDQFRRQLVDNPEDAIQAAGFQLTEEELEAVKSVDLGLSQEELEERVSKIWGAPAP
ncbi:MAG: Ribosomally synthesized peptide, partial [Paenibacillus sp.]|nr:Ribosomally synthesized peptide [Paenibacillus sp.]